MIEEHSLKDIFMEYSYFFNKYIVNVDFMKVIINIAILLYLLNQLNETGKVAWISIDR